MTFQRIFDTAAALPVLATESRPPGHDPRDGSIYVLDSATERAIRVALVTGRPLLLGGPPGSGKSSLAPYVARILGWNYFEFIVTSATRAEELRWSVDEVRRLRDATANRLIDDLRAYMEPGVFWWAFSPESAKQRGFVEGELPQGLEKHSLAGLEAKPPSPSKFPLRIGAPSVILLDEIDKADPDVPNDCLVALGSQYFPVTGTPVVVEARQNVPFVVITSNDERTLSKAFIRRCIVHRLEPPPEERLIDIARAHFPQQAELQGDLLKTLAQRVVAERQVDDERIGPSTAEYLDAVRACLELEVYPQADSVLWQTIEATILQKRQSRL